MRTRLTLLTALALTLLVAACGDDGGSPATDAADNNATNNAAGEGTNNETTGQEGPAQRELPPGPWAVDAYGHYGVGVATHQVSYTASDGEERELRVVIWYPTRDEGAEPPTGSGIVSVEGATVGVEEPAPVVLFSHGSGGFPEQSVFFTNFLTSHGYIVVAPSHTGNDQFGQPIDVRFFSWRPQDVTATLDYVQALPEDDPLHGKLSDQIAATGHSFGGYTALALAGASFDLDRLEEECGRVGVCGWLEAGAAERLEAGFRDERVLAAVPMAPAGARLFYGGAANTEAPVLLITGGGDQTLPDRTVGDPLWDAMDGADDVRLHIIPAGHYSFTDLCASLGSFFEDDGCGPTFASPERVHGYVNLMSLAFLRLHLRGDDSGAAWLDGEEDLGSGAVVSGK